MGARDSESLHEQVWAQLGIRKVAINIGKGSRPHCLTQHGLRAIVDGRRVRQACREQRGKGFLCRAVLTGGQLACDRVETAKVVRKQARHRKPGVKDESVHVAGPQQPIDAGAGDGRRQPFAGVHAACIRAGQVDDADPPGGRHDVAAVKVAVDGTRRHAMNKVMIKSGAGNRGLVPRVVLRVEGR
ncbi:hypothetical protein G6F22_015595 [Rhizopus arrhizus]|nr:hypothetical protein G6F22_015595 [Rhizopus arrhizus]